MGARFVKNNLGFKCAICETDVPPHPSSSRDHCTQCLYSMHVDVDPGDRENPCQGILKPVGLEIKKGEKRILYECERCRVRIVNVVAPDDNPDKVVELAGFHKFYHNS